MLKQPNFSIDPALISASFAGLETAIAKALEYDPSSRQRLQKLAPKVLRIRCNAPAIEAYVCLDTDGVKIKQFYEGSPNTEISGSLPALAALGVSDRHNLSGSGVQVIGSTALLAELQGIAADLDIDWEEPLSQLLGDFAGPHIAGLMRNSFSWLAQRSKNFARNSGLFISEESMASVSKPQLEQFTREVGQFRSDSDRVAAKFQQLQQQLDQKLQASTTPKP